MYSYDVGVAPDQSSSKSVAKSRFHSCQQQKVQRRATKLLLALKEKQQQQEQQNLSYDARLKMLDLPTLKYRWFRGGMIQVYKIINNVDNINFDTYFCKPISEKTRDSEVNLFVTHCNTNKIKNAFSNRSAQDWNTLTTNTQKLQA